METLEYKMSVNGKRIFSFEAKKKIIAELDSGKSPAEISRQHGVPIRYFHAWRSAFLKGAHVGLKSNEEVVPLSSYKKLEEEIKKLRQTLGKVVQEREILKDAVQIASKKKWI